MSGGDPLPWRVAQQGGGEREAAAERLQRRLDEMAMLQVMFSDALTHPERALASLQAWQAYHAEVLVSDPRPLSEPTIMPCEPLSCQIRLLSTAPALRLPSRRRPPTEHPLLDGGVYRDDHDDGEGGAGGPDIDPDAPFDFTMTVVMPNSYPDAGPLEWTFDSLRTTKTQRNAALEAVNDCIKAQAAGAAPCAMVVLEAAKDAVLQARTAEVEDELECIQERARRTGQAEADALEELIASAASGNLLVSPVRPDSDLHTRRLGRRAIYFHHILSVGKRQCIARWARMLRINGFAKVGYPGILIVEGPENGIQEYVRGLQRLRWKLMVVRGEEVLLAPTTTELAANSKFPPDSETGGSARRTSAPQGAASQGTGCGPPLDAIRVIPWHGVIEMAASSEIADRCAQCGLTELFRTSMKIYS